MKSITIEFNKFNFAKGITIGLVVGELILLFLLGMVAVVMTSTGILNNSILEIALTVICGISTFFCGFTSSKIIKAKGLINGAICGFAFFIILFSAGMIMMDGTLTIFTFLKFIVSILCGAIGGLTGLNKKEKLIG